MHYPATARVNQLKALIALFTLLLTACSPPTFDNHLDTYVDRLTRVLELELTPVQLPMPPALPRPRDLQADPAVETGDIDVLDFMALQGCELQQTIAGNNNQLGRLASHSGQLVYTLSFLAQAPACIAHLTAEGETSLAEALTRETQRKRERLGTHIYMATLGGEEWRSLWKPSPRQLDPIALGISDTTNALQSLLGQSRRWLAGDYRVDSKALELELAALRSHAGGDLMRQLAQQMIALSVLNQALSRRGEPACHSSTDPKAEILANVVRKYFVGQVQVRSVALNRTHQQLMQSITGLEALLNDHAAPAYSQWMQARDQWLHVALDAPSSHVSSLRPAMEECGVAPAAS